MSTDIFISVHNGRSQVDSVRNRCAICVSKSYGEMHPVELGSVKPTVQQARRLRSLSLATQAATKLPHRGRNPLIREGSKYQVDDSKTLAHFVAMAFDREASRLLRARQPLRSPLSHSETARISSCRLDAIGDALSAGL